MASKWVARVEEEQSGQEKGFQGLRAAVVDGKGI